MHRQALRLHEKCDRWIKGQHEFLTAEPINRHHVAAANSHDTIPALSQAQRT